MPENTPRKKRRIYFIDKKFQTNFIVRFCVLVILAGLLIMGLLYLFALHSTTVAILNSRVVVRSTADFLLPLLLQTLIMVAIFAGLATIWLTLLVSHKLAGPLYRFRNVMQLLGEGDFSKEFKIRKNDQLQDLADEFNIMIKKIREEIGVLKNGLSLLKEKLNNAPNENCAVSINELKKISDDIQRLINYFKT